MVNPKSKFKFLLGLPADLSRTDRGYGAKFDSGA